MKKLKRPEVDACSVRLDSIELHDLFVQHRNLVDSCAVVLKEFQAISREAQDYMLAFHPVLVTDIKRQERYCCIAGVRTLNLISSNRRGSESIMVKVIKNLSDADITDICCADLFFTPLVMGLSNPGQQLFDLRNALIRINSGGCWGEIMTCSKNKFGAMIGVSPSNLHY